MVKKRQQFKQLFRKIVILRTLAALPPQSEAFETASSGRAADAEIDATRIQRVKHSKSFHHFERTVMRQQDAARPDANAGSLGANPRDKNLGRRAGKSLDGVMFGNPISLEAERVGRAGQLDRIAERVRRSVTLRYR